MPDMWIIKPFFIHTANTLKTALKNDFIAFYVIFIVISMYFHL